MKLIDGALLEIKRQAIRQYGRTKTQIRCRRCKRLLRADERMNYSRMCDACDVLDVYVPEQPLSNEQRVRNAYLRGDEV